MSRPLEIEAALFDLDGLLVESESAWHRARKGLAAAHGAVFPDGPTSLIPSSFSVDASNVPFDISVDAAAMAIQQIHSSTDAQSRHVLLDAELIVRSSTRSR